jgi:hypothetical protein
MNRKVPGLLTKLKWSLPWAMHYPAWRLREAFRRMADSSDVHHLILIVANHFEPGWNQRGETLGWSTQMARLEHWCEEARMTGRLIHDGDGTAFRHTYFYPAEQYHPALLDRLAELEAEGLGEVEIHLHHGVGEPDTADNLRRSLLEFRDALAERHRCLSRRNGVGAPLYGFLHGNFALANSAGGRCCGVDSEMQILADTGCYADFTLPAFPHQAQVPKINALYQCGHPLDEARPHRAGRDLRVGEIPKLPVLITGPLVFDWRRRSTGLPLPKVDDGGLTAACPPDERRLHNWHHAGISVRGKPDWIFIKLYCHGFFEADESAMIGDRMRRFLHEALESAEQTNQIRIHFATAREAFNLALAALDGRTGAPDAFRNYRLVPIRQNAAAAVTATVGSRAFL